jgi:ubiquinone/menaquinone biosynthesis C-methylase UbiE
MKNTSFNASTLFDSMADEYDDIKDLWYAWLLSRLHYFIVLYLRKIPQKPPLQCLDVGCGTGFQSSLLSLCGNFVKGIDISSGLIEKAKQKYTTDYLTQDLFQTPYNFTKTYSEKIRYYCELLRCTNPIVDPQYDIQNAIDIPYQDETFDLINCCGSTLSFIEDYEKAISEMSRVLKPGGIIILEVENRYNLDLIWPLIDTLLFGSIGFDQPFKVSLKNAFSKFNKHVKTDFPFSTHTGEVIMPIRLFSSRKLLKELKTNGIVIQEKNVIHNFTNSIPSVFLDQSEPSTGLIKIFGMLSKIEQVTYSIPIFRHFGCSLVLFGTKNK